MTSTKTVEQRLYDGSRAKEVLENEAFQQAFADIEQEVIEQWKSSPARDEAGREKLWIYLMLLKKVQTHLQSSLEGGKLAQLEVEHRNKVQEIAKAGMRWFRP